MAKHRSLLSFNWSTYGKSATTVVAFCKLYASITATVKLCMHTWTKKFVLTVLYTGTVVFLNLIVKYSMIVLTHSFVL